MTEQRANVLLGVQQAGQEHARVVPDAVRLGLGVGVAHVQHPVGGEPARLHSGADGVEEVGLEAVVEVHHRPDQVHGGTGLAALDAEERAAAQVRLRGGGLQGQACRLAQGAQPPAETTPTERWFDVRGHETNSPRVLTVRDHMIAPGNPVPPFSGQGETGSVASTSARTSSGVRSLVGIVAAATAV